LFHSASYALSTGGVCPAIRTHPSCSTALLRAALLRCGCQSFVFTVHARLLFLARPLEMIFRNCPSIAGPQPSGCLAPQGPASCTPHPSARPFSSPPVVCAPQPASSLPITLHRLCNRSFLRVWSIAHTRHAPPWAGSWVPAGEPPYIQFSARPLASSPHSPHGVWSFG